MSRASRYEDGHNCGPGMVYDTPEEKEIARLTKELDAVRAERDELELKTGVCMGVGTGAGNLFVYGDYESIKAAQAIVLERDQLRSDLALAREENRIIISEFATFRSLICCLLHEYGIKSNPGWTEKDIVDALSKALTKDSYNE